MNWFKRLNYKRKRKIVAKRIIQRERDKTSINVFNKISDNFEAESLEKIEYGYRYKLISIIKVTETDGTYEGTEEYCLLSINGDEIKSKYNENIFNLLKTKWIEGTKERLELNVRSL